MKAEQIREKILQILGDIAPGSDTVVVDPNVSFHDQFEIDSIDFLRLMLELEKEFKLTIFDFDYPKLSTLQGCENYLAVRLTD